MIKQYSQLGAAMIEVAMRVKDGKIVKIKREKGIWYVA